MNNENTQTIGNTGGSLADAVDMMPDVEQMERDRGIPARDDTGRFTSNSAHLPRPEEEQNARELQQSEEADASSASQTGDSSDERQEDGQEEHEGREERSDASGSGKDAQQVDPSSVEEDWIEVNVDGQEEPLKLSVNDVYQGYERAKELEAEVENLKQSTPPPPDYDSAIMAAIEKGQEYLTGLKQVEQMLQPIEPDQNLINPGSPHYDPETYFQQQQYATQQREHLKAVQAQREAAEQEVNQRESAVAQARFQREQQKLMEMWPEIKEEAAANAVRDDASRYYGLDNQTLDSVHDSRFYAVLKDALAYRKQQSTEKKAVRKVKAKPKLVKGAARNTESPQRRSNREAMERLSQSGSRDDAIAALDGLLDLD